MIKTMRFKKMVGQGLYTPGQAARLAGMSASTLNYWIGHHKGVPSVIARRLLREHLVTFAELMELKFISMFRHEGVSLQTIRKAAETAAQRFNIDYPFAVKRFDTDGNLIFATMIDAEHDRTIVEELKHGQLVFE